MKRSLAAGMFLLLVGAIVAFAQEKKDTDKDKDKDTHDSLLKSILGVISKATDTLAKVKDVETAKTAKPDLEKIAQEMHELQVRSQKLGKPNDEQNKTLEKKYGEQLRKAAGDLNEQAERVTKETYGKDLLEVLRKDQKKPDDAGTPKTAKSAPKP